jgi:hypothetical protein
MSESEPMNMDNDNSGLSRARSSVNAMLPKNRCEKAILGLYFVLFILVLSMTGTVIQEGKSDNKSVSWALFVFSLLLGLITVVVMVKAKRNRKIYISILSILIALMNMIAMILSGPELSTRELVTPHFANVTFAIVSVLAAIYSN